MSSTVDIAVGNRELSLTNPIPVTVVGQGSSTSVDRELIVTTYTCKTAFTGASVGDTITATQVIDVSGEAPSTVSTIWHNQTTAADLSSAPSAANLELRVSTALTDAQLRASAVATNPDATRGGGTIDAKTLRVTLATDGPVVTAVGATNDAAAAADGTGSYSIISALKRGLLNWATLLGRIPAQLTPGLMPVDTLATPGAPRVQATSAASAGIVLTATCRRVSMYATQGTWYSITGAATAASHYIGAGERLDFDVPASTTISVLQETTAGSVRVTELA